MQLSIREILPLLKRALEEDINTGDITSEAILSEKYNTAYLITKADGVIAGLSVAEAVFKLLDEDIKFHKKVEDGKLLKNGTKIAEIYGNTCNLLKAERVALNFLQRMSGIATLTYQYVKKLEGLPCRLLDTRKTTPTLRLLEKYSVLQGGGYNHRFGLYDMVMIKDNHISAAGSITKAVELIREYFHKKKIEKPIEVETKNIIEIKEVLPLEVERIMLDNMGLEIMSEAVKLIHSYSGKIAEIEASGGVNLETIRDIAKTGVDFISVGAITHSVKALDISMLLF